jgi:hypothetical protein
MGKREKEHRKKVQKRNEKIKQQQLNFQKEVQKMINSIKEKEEQLKNNNQ